VFNVVPTAQRKRRDRLSEDGSAGARTQAQVDHSPALAYALRIDFERFAKMPRKSGAIFMVDMAHYAGLSPQRLPQPCRMPTSHFDHPQDPAAPARRHHPDEAEHEKAINSRSSRLQGARLMHVIPQGSGVQEASTKNSNATRTVIDNALVMCKVLVDAACDHLRRPRSHVFLVDLRARTQRQGSERSSPRPHHGQQELHPNDPQSLSSPRHPHRHAA